MDCRKNEAAVLLCALAVDIILFRACRFCRIVPPLLVEAFTFGKVATISLSLAERAATVALLTFRFHLPSLALLCLDTVTPVEPQTEMCGGFDAFDLYLLTDPPMEEECMLPDEQVGLDLNDMCNFWHGDGVP